MLKYCVIHHTEHNICINNYHSNEVMWCKLQISLYFNIVMGCLEQKGKLFNFYVFKNYGSNVKELAIQLEWSFKAKNNSLVSKSNLKEQFSNHESRDFDYGLPSSKGSKVKVLVWGYLIISS